MAQILLVRSAEAPGDDRLGHEILGSLANDDTIALKNWLQDPSTHVEDREVRMCSTLSNILRCD
jgi:hypothetical protein